MIKETVGTVVTVKKLWWIKINTKAVRMGPLDGAIFPHIAKVSYPVDGAEFCKRKWIGAGRPVPEVGSAVKVRYEENAPKKAEVIF